MSQLIQNISDTAKWVAVFRAEESERPDAVFKDPYARKLAGEKGEQIAADVQFSRQNSWSFVARTYLFDEYIMQQVKRGFDMVINLASGLDARPFRMDLPPTLKWIEVDLPGIMQEKNKILKDEKPKCELRSIELDLAERKERLKLFEQLNKECKKALIVTEGLMTYLTAEQAAELSLDLANQNHFHDWVFDIQSPALLQMAIEKMGAALTGSGAKFQFAPEEGEMFFENFGWNHIESKSKLKTALLLNRLTGELKTFGEMPEPPGPKRPFPWSGVCLFENVNAA